MASISEHDRKQQLQGQKQRPQKRRPLHRQRRTTTTTSSSSIINHASTHMLLFAIVLSLTTVSITAQTPTPKPNVPWIADVEAVYDTQVSDEFNDKTLNLDIWDEHGIRSPDTNCPTWNGPPSSVADPAFSTFFPAVDHPKKPNKKVRQYKLANGNIQLRISKKKTKFFKQREYYCDADTFTCNHDSSIPCYWTNFFGEPVYTDNTNTTYAGIVHDKCKKSPFCIPHFEKVEGKTERTYSKYTSAHLTGKNLFKYGFIETRVKLADASNILAVWMHGRNSTGPGYCRFRRAEGFAAGVRRECPSSIKSDRWQEIDLVEAMNSDIHKKRYIPNIHVFAGSKGEFTSKDSVDDGSGKMGGGPIVIQDALFNQYDMFNGLTAEERKGNEFHWTPGTIVNFTESWADAWHVLGCYWSKNEIRFYVDGEEIYRMDNLLVHQFMALDVSSALNVGWSNQIPDDSRINQWGLVDYVRVWSIFTKDGNDPPSSLPLLNPMGRKFEPKFGNQMYGVYDRYPHNDEVTLLPVSTSTTSDAAKDPSSVIIPIVDTDDQSKEENRNVVWKPVSGGSANVPGGARFEEEEEVEDDLHILNARQGRGRGRGNRLEFFMPAGKARRRRMKRKSLKSNGFQRSVMYSRPNRVSKLVKKSANGKKNVYGTVEDPGQTVYEWHNPNGVGAGFNSKNGDGENVD